MPATLPYGLYARRTTPSTGVRRPSYRRFPISRRVRGVRWYNWSRCHVTVAWSPVVKREGERETPVGEPSVEPNTPDPGERAGCRTAARRATSRRLALRVRGRSRGRPRRSHGRLDTRRTGKAGNRAKNAQSAKFVASGGAAAEAARSAVRSPALYASRAPRGRHRHERSTPHPAVPRRAAAGRRAIRNRVNESTDCKTQCAMYQRGAGQPAGPALHFRPHGNYFACRANVCGRAPHGQAIDRASRESHDVCTRDSSTGL
jgi:hypothetical protein